MLTLMRGKKQQIVEILLAVLAGVLGWNAVSWATQPGLFLYIDELANPTRFHYTTFSGMFTILPNYLYNDRPVGFIFEQILFDTFGFNYRPQLILFLLIHVSSCVMSFFLFRRMGVATPLSLGVIGLYSTLWTTAETATYLGAVFDVLGFFLVLACILTFLSENRWVRWASVVLLLLALRTKEFAIVVPVLLAILGPWKRAWPHFLVAFVVGVRYITLVPKFLESFPPGNPYRPSVGVGTILDSYSHYTALVFSFEQTALARAPLLIAILFAAIAGYAVYRRKRALLFSISAFVLLLLPIAILPGIRAALYVYGPQMFLLLAGALLLEDLVALIGQPSVQWTATAVIAILLLGSAAYFRQRNYFGDRVAFIANARRISTVSAASLQSILPMIPAGARVFVNNRDQTAWLLMHGPCVYFELMKRDRSITCVLNQPEEALKAQYAQAPEPKLFLDYDAGTGGFKVSSGL